MYFNSKRNSDTVEKFKLNTAEKFMEQVYSDPHIYSLCYVPLCLNMVLECFEHDDKIFHKTFTDLYQTFVVSRVNRHIRSKKAVPLGTVQESDKEFFKNLDNLLSNVPEVLEGAQEILFLLSKLAYYSYFKWCEQLNSNEKTPKVVYVTKQLTHCDITNLENDACGLLKATKTLYGIDNTAVYSFNHLSVQEYFCALYISLLPEEQQLQLLKGHMLMFPYIWPFYAGITKLRSSDVSNYLYHHMLEDIHLKNSVQSENPTFINCRNVIKNCNISDQQTMIVLNSIHEAQLSSDVYKHEVYALFMSQHRFRLYDYTCISYFMSIAPITQLYLPWCNIRDREVKILARCKQVIPSLKVLDLSFNHITHEGIEHLIPIITNLTHLSVAHNPNIGDDGIKLFSKPPLKFSSLIQLDIRYIGMTIDGALYGLREYVKHNNSLQSLEISNNNIKGIGLEPILTSRMEDLRSYNGDSLNTSLVRLSIRNCNFVYISSFFMIALLVYKTLKHLEISENRIRDVGIFFLSFFLEKHVALVQLSAHSCGFHSEGGKSIAGMLQVNKTLKYLNISNNDIGDDGIVAITHSVKGNTTLVQLKIYDCSYGSKGLEAVNKMLKVNKTLIELCISVRVEEQQHIDEVARTVLETFLEDDCTLLLLKVCSRSHGIREFINIKEKMKMSSTTVYTEMIRPYGNGLVFCYNFKV